MLLELLYISVCYAGMGVAYKFFLLPEKPKVRSIEDWAMANKDKLTPDQLISAYIIKSLAKNFSDWELQRQKRDRCGNFTWHKTYDLEKFSVFRIYNSKLDLAFEFTHLPPVSSRNLQRFLVQGQKIDYDDANQILTSYLEIRTRQKEIEEAAEAARHKMEEEQNKWELAEKLIGMTRINGALVPAYSFCRDCVRHDGTPITIAGEIVYLCKACKKKLNRRK